MKMWVDTKIDLILETLRQGPSPDDLQLIVTDIHGAFDSARRYPIEDVNLLRIRCNKILVCAKMAERGAWGKDLESLRTLEGRLLNILRDRVEIEVKKDGGDLLPPNPFRSH